MPIRNPFIALALTLATFVPVIAAQTPEDLSNQVMIRRTEYGVPHILADNERAAGFGMGYVQAEDHCQTIMRHILSARGELAATFGDVDDNVEKDFWNKQYRIFDRANETYGLLDADWRAMLEGYATGFNVYVEQHRSELPDWVRSITGPDVAAHGLTGVARFAFNRGKIVDKFVAAMKGGENPVVRPEDIGSNMWAFDGTRTESGKAILMGNPHQPWSDVATYYEAHITIPGRYNMYGSTFIGRPVLTTGFNQHLGWTHTVNYPDLEEIYSLALNRRNANEYMYDGRAIPITRSVAKVGVKSRSGTANLERTFEYTPLGPVIYRDSSNIYVLKSAAYDEYRFYQQWYRLGQAKDFAGYHKALEAMSIPMFNIGYADDKGNIYYLWNGTVPRLPHASHDAVAVRAEGRSDVWSSFVSLNDLPQLLNPKGGYVMNSNSAPYFTNLNERLRRSNYPAYFPDNYLSMRSQHSLQLINNDRKFSLDAIIKLKFNEYALLASRVKDDLIAAVEAGQGGSTVTTQTTTPAPAKPKSDLSTILGILSEVEKIISDRDDKPTPTTQTTTVSGGDPEVARALDTLRSWDGSLAKGSRGSALFQEWWTTYCGELDYNTDRTQLFAEDWSETRPIETPRGLRNPEKAAQAFHDAMASLKQQYGTWDVTWGDIHRFRRGNVNLPMGGGGHDLGAFRVVLYDKASDGRYVANSGDSWIFAVEFGATPKAYTVVAYSQSGDPKSAHYNDQAELYIGGKMKRAAFTESEIQAQLEREYTPVRAKSLTDQLIDRIRH